MHDDLSSSKRVISARIFPTAPTCVIIRCMSEMPDGRVPDWDTADRMRKALRDSGISVQAMADYLGVSRNTVGTWINGRIKPSTQTIRLWSLRCGVSYGWLSGDPTTPTEEAYQPLTGRSSRGNHASTTPIVRLAA